MIQSRHWLPPDELFERLAISASERQLDYRSQLLIRDCLNALATKLGADAVRNRIASLPSSKRLRELWETDFEETGFPSLGSRIVEPLTQQQINRFFTYLGGRLSQPTTIVVGGSVSLMLRSLIARHTEHVDVVNDIPEPIRRDYQLIDDLKATQNLHLGHFAQHYLPDGWERRVSSYHQFDRLQVKLVDPIDVLVGKLFSQRNKDLLDLQEAWGRIDQAAFRARLERDTRGLRTIGYLGDRPKLNWKVLTGEQDLPQLT